MKRKEVVLSFLVFLAISISSVQATPALSGSAFGSYMPGFNAGSWGTTSLEYIDTSVEADSGYDDPYVDWNLSVHFKADVSQGAMGADLLSHTTTIGPGRTGPGAGADATMQDYFHIGAGTSGLSNGAEVQIRFNSAFNGSILLEGKPSGGCFVHYVSRFYGSTGVTLAELDTYNDVNPDMISLYPLVDRDISAAVNQVVTVHVGDVIQVYSYLSMDLNGSAYGTAAYGYPMIQGDNNLNFLDGGYAGIGYADGYEDLNIWSDGGASIVPEPMTISMLGFGSVCLLARRKKA
jgi:hypothetical protein